MKKHYDNITCSVCLLSYCVLAELHPNRVTEPASHIDMIGDRIFILSDERILKYITCRVCLLSYCISQMKLLYRSISY